MNKVVNFISGNEYSLSALFGGDVKVIIPDLQRDYCWGDNAVVDRNMMKKKELVSDFVKNIVELFTQKSENVLTMGLIYGFEQPHGHIQICDGQQRLTTLFLLLGYINMKCLGKYDDYIISEHERNDDFEPHLQYAIRESTLYFLSDLSRHVFIDRDTEIESIRKSSWYFKEYDFDASIQSMISALQIIDSVFAASDFEEYLELGEFVLNNLRVLYYDMNNRSRGEETYVVINTTGEPLSSTENIKPILLGNPSLTEEKMKFYSDQWEEREEWFWKNRGNDTTADSGMQVFFTWYWQIGLMQERAWVNDKPVALNPRDLFVNAPSKWKDNPEEISFSKDNYVKFRDLDNIDKYFKALKSLVDNIVADSDIQSVLDSIKCTQKKNKDVVLESSVNVWNWLRTADLDVVLPLITLLAEHPRTKQLKAFVRRIRRNYFDGLWAKLNNNEVSRRGRNKMDWRYLVQIINQTTDEDFLTADTSRLALSKIPLIDIPVWFDKNEQVKHELKKSHGERVNQWEDNEFLMGDLTPLWSMYGDDEITFNTLEKRFVVIDKLCRMLHRSKVAEGEFQYANWFRLYRVISGLVGFGHIPNTIWEFEGCFFSQKPSSPWWLEMPQIVDLLSSEDHISFMKEYVRSKVADFIREPHDHIQLIESWLTLKVLKADHSDQGVYLVNYYNGRAVSAYKSLSSNYIVPCDHFDWGNVLLGYSYSYTIYPARDYDNWSKPDNLDSPLLDIPFIKDYYKREHHHIDDSDRQRVGDYIGKLIDDFLACKSE